MYQLGYTEATTENNVRLAFCENISFLVLSDILALNVRSVQSENNRVTRLDKIITECEN